MAVEAATIHGVYPTTRRPGLNPTRLKQWVQTLRKGTASADGLRFVEFPWLGPSPVPECILEAEDYSGTKLRIHLKSYATARADATR